MRKTLLPLIFIFLLTSGSSWAGGLFPGTAGVSEAEDVTFDNTTASLTGDPVDVQGAIEAIKTEMGSLEAGGLSDLDDLPGDTTDNNLVDFVLLQGVQPLEATLTDIADGTIAENLVNTANPWADNEVADTITVGSSGSVNNAALDADLQSIAANFAGIALGLGNGNGYQALQLKSLALTGTTLGLGPVLSMTNNTDQAPTGGAFQVYFDNGKFTVNQNGVEGLPGFLGDANTWTAEQTFSSYVQLGTSSWPGSPDNGQFGYDGTHLYFQHGATLTDLLAAGHSEVTVATGIGAISVTGQELSASSIIEAISDLSNSAGYLKNDGSGNFSYDTPPTATAASLHVDDILTAIGIASEAVNLGEFTGTTINDNVTVKAALQALETAVEGVESGGLADIDDLPGDTTDDNLIDAALLADLSATYTTTAHTHTGTTISSIDISDDTNLAGTTNEITLTGDTLSLASTLDLSGKTLTLPAYTQAAVASPAQTLYDSDAPGAEAADKLVGQFWAQYVDGAEGLEDSSAGIKVMIGGTLTDMIWYGHASDTVYSARDVDVIGCVYISSGIDFGGGAAPTMNSAGRLDFDTTITGWTGGGLVYTPDGTNIRYIVDIPSGSTLTDGHTPHWDTSTNGWVLEADATGGAGTGSVTTVKEADSQVGGADIVTLDFGVGFDVAESPDTEVQITLDLAEYAGAIAGSDITLTGADTSPDAAGEIRFDSTVTGLATGALAWYDGDEVRYLVDLDVLPSNDDYVVAYDADNDNFYMKADATGGAGTPAGDGTPDGQLQYANDANDAMTAEDAFYYEADTNTLYVDNITYTGLVTGPAGTDPYTYYNETDGTDWWTGVDDTGNSFEWRTNATVGNSVHMELEEDGDLVVGGDLTVTGNDLVFGTAAAGVTLTGDGDGALEIHGFGDGDDENLVINLDDTANTASISSDTGVTTIALGAIGMTTSGPIEITDASTGLIIRDTEGQRYRITVSTAGVLTATEL